MCWSIEGILMITVMHHFHIISAMYAITQSRHKIIRKRWNILNGPPDFNLLRVAKLMLPTQALMKRTAHFHQSKKYIYKVEHPEDSMLTSRWVAGVEQPDCTDSDNHQSLKPVKFNDFHHHATPTRSKQKHTMNFHKQQQLLSKWAGDRSPVKDLESSEILPSVFSRDAITQQHGWWMEMLSPRIYCVNLRTLSRAT